MHQIIYEVTAQLIQNNNSGSPDSLVPAVKAAHGSMHQVEALVCPCPASRWGCLSLGHVSRATSLSVWCRIAAHGNGLDEGVRQESKGRRQLAGGSPGRAAGPAGFGGAPGQRQRPQGTSATHRSVVMDHHSRHVEDRFYTMTSRATVQPAPCADLVRAISGKAAQLILDMWSLDLMVGIACGCQESM